MNILHSQNYHRTDSIKVKVSPTGNYLKMPWVGGHNFCQFSDIDINQDGIKDLFVFDRTSHKVTTYINGGTPNKVDYYDSTTKYASKFPHMEDWALIRDYNCDGKPDIFTYAITVGGMKVWKNTSSGGNLQFTLEKTYLISDYGSSSSNLYCSRIDLPSITDVDGDGDLDIVTVDFSLTMYEYHINRSEELGYGCDSLIYKKDAGCWGHFSEPFTGCGVNLNQSCRMRTDDSANIHPFYPPMTREEEYQYAIEHDGGNCALCLDIDADGDKDLLLGQKCCNMTMVTNGGTAASANMISKDTLFPSYDIPVTVTSLPCGFFVDVNNDSKRDLIVCPNMVGISVDNDGIWYYENIGTDSAPVFSRKKRSLLQEEMIDIGSGSDPVFFDFDNDGLTDILISNYSMELDSTCLPPDYSNNVRAYKNIGTASNPQFEMADSNFANLSVQLPTLPGKHLTFGDLDGDGVKDMMIGDYNGFIHYFKNTGGTGPANFVLTTSNFPDDTNTPIDIGSFATPQLIDVDRDGDLDLIIGERSGNINYYQNTGTSSLPVFKFITSNFGGVDVLKPCCTGYSVPFMYDKAGSYVLLVGSEASRNYPAQGWIWAYDNIDGNLGGNFHLLDSMYQNIWEGERMAVNGKDINGDSRMDLVIGNYCGGIAMYLADSSTTGISETNNQTFDFTIYPNPSTDGKFQVSISSLPAAGRSQVSSLEIYNMIGEKVYEENFIKGSKEINITSEGLGQGVYICKINGEKFSTTKKLVILK